MEKIENAVKPKRTTMKDRIIDYMKRFGAITTRDAFVDLGCTRLSEYIRQIRQEYDVKDEWMQVQNRFGEKTEIKKFWLGEKYA